MSPDDGRVVSWPQRRVELGGRHGTRFKNGTPHKRHEPGHGSPKHGLSVGAPLRSFFGFRILPKETDVRWDFWWWHRVEASHTDEKMGRAELGGPAPPGRYPEPLGECSGGCRRYRLSPIAGRFGNYL